jgi:hypothetical protein
LPLCWSSSLPACLAYGEAVIVVPDYRGHRIEVYAVAADDRWNADVFIRRSFTEDKTFAERVTCFKVSAALAEAARELWAKRWIDHVAV